MDHHVEPAKRKDQRPRTPGTAAAPQIIQVEELMAGAREVILRYRGESYRLRVTRNAKLILHK